MINRFRPTRVVLFAALFLCTVWMRAPLCAAQPESNEPEFNASAADPDHEGINEDTLPPARHWYGNFRTLLMGVGVIVIGLAFALARGNRGAAPRSPLVGKTRPFEGVLYRPGERDEDE